MDEPAIRENPSPNRDERTLPISMVVLHYTGMPTGEEAEARLVDPEAKVSAHYLIHEDGVVVRLVPEEQRAWHAGRSYWQGITDVNSASIGIELVNPGHEWGYRAFPDAQIAALVPLLAAILQRHTICPGNVVGHSDVAPARKDDPGELFPWHLLARHRLALPAPIPTPIATPPKPVPRELLDNPGTFYRELERFGYDVSDGPAAVRAFQRRWRPDLIDGLIDEQTGALLIELLARQDRGLA